MSKINSQRLEKYRNLSKKNLWDIEHSGFNAFYKRALAETVP